MSTFSIAVFDPNGNPAIVPASLDVQPQTWAAIAQGGMWDAQIAVFGGLDELAGLTSWLGYRLEILNANSTAVWWGDVAAVEVTANGLRRGVTLERMANRVQVRYAQGQPGGGATSADTEWADNALSQAKYGVWEKRLSAPRTMTANEADSYRDTALGMLGEPHYTLAIDAATATATIYCTGYWQRNKRNYYSQTAGLLQHVASGSPAPLGLGFTSSTVAFVARTDAIHSIAGYFANFSDGMRVRVSGAAQGGNNASWLLASGGDDRTAIAYTSTGVTFAPQDDIADSNGGLGFLAQDDVFTIASSSLNNGTHLLDKAGAVTIEISGSYYGSAIEDESPGNSVVFSRGNAIEVTGNLTNEPTGNSVTITAWGMKHYQPFTLATDSDWTAAAVEIRLRRVGGPADGVIVQLVQDSSGSPGTVLDSATVAADDIPLEMGWVSFDLSNADTLEYGTTYGLTVARTGSNDPADYYEIDLDEGATYTGGALKQWDGAAWQTPSPAADMVFRVLGATDTGAQIAAVLSLQGWAATIDVASTAISANQYRGAELRAIDELDALLEMGTAAGLRLVAHTHRSLGVSVYERADRSEARWTYDGGQLRDLFGQDAEAGFLPAGEWVRLGDSAGLGPWAALSPVFVERAEYSAESGLSLEPEGNEDIYDAGAVQG